MGKRRGRRLRTLHCKNSVHQRLSLPQTRCASNEQESVYNGLTWGKRAKVGSIQDRLTQPELSIHESDKTESITDRLSRPVPLPSDQTTVGGVRSRLTFPGSSTSGSVQDRLTRPELSMYEIDETESIVDRLSRPVPLPSGHTTVGGECSRLTIPGSSTSDTTVTSSNGGLLTELGSLTCQESNLGSSFLQLTKVNNLDAKPTALRLCLGDLSRKRLLGSESCENQNTVTDECRISQRKRKRLEYDYALTDLEEANCECEDATYASDPEISWDEMNQFGQRDSSTSRSHSHDRSRGRGRGRGAYNCSERGNWRSGSPGNVNRWANSYELPMTRRGAQSFDGGLNSFARDNYTAPLGWDEMNQFGQRDSSTSRSHSHDRSRGRGRGRGAYNCSERGNWRSGSPGNVNRWANSYELPMTRRGAQSFDGGLNSFARDNYTAPLGNERRGRGYRGRGNRGGRGKYFPNESHGMGSTEDYHDNRERGRGSFRARASGRIHPHRKEREHPIGFKDLEKILSLPADAVPLELLRGHSGYALLLKEDSMKDEKFILLIKILSHATDTKSNKESLYELFNSTCNQRFMDRLCCFAMTVRRKFIDEAKEYFSNLFQFLNTYSNAMTTSAIDLVPNVLDACISCMIHLESVAFVSQDLITKYETLQEMLTEAAQHWKQQSSQSTNRTGQGDEMDRVREPPDDFREISILPTSLDLIKNNRPFLRKNITEGKYIDEFHYLDVQFRLLREDFVKPLRTGISDYKDGAKSRFQNIRIYRGVTVVGTSFTKKKMMHLLKLNLPKHIKNIENSKRLLFGNLLCLSNDNFRTLVFASVADRDAELYKNEGIIGVQFETDIENVDFSKNFVMAESKAYFMAYKHVLKALQEMVDNGVALAPYIIKVQPNVDPPKYMGAGEIYDLRVMKHMKLMKRAEARNRLFDFEDETVELEDDLMPHLRQVFIQRDLISWPSEDDLGLDSSQRRALRSALTRQLAIIQGPPGTGKTFIGLKITQILLHNSSTWKDADRPTPILVVCFTNHALDQFLEGMTLYTNNIVRVGSRTKSEKISRFQVNSLVRSLHGSRGIPAAIHEMGNTLFHEIMDLESSISKLRATLNACRYMKGIVMLSQFSENNIIPSHLKQQLSKIGLKNWLLLSIYPQAMGKTEKPKQQKESTKVQNRVQDQENLVCVTNPQGDELDSDEEFQDAEEFIKQQEQERYLGDDDADSVDLDVKTYNVEYELSDEMLAFEMETARQAYQDNKDNFEAAFKYDILAGQREVLGIGLDMPLDLEMAANLEKQLYLDLSRLDFPSRWLLYKFWMKKMGDNIGKALSKLESRYQRKSKAHKEIKDQEYLYLMRHASIVGMTTTGAAQYCSIMQDLGPSIVIIEEAAEILESHVITSLTSKCQHLIMIGDHQQLRPSATVFELATKFGLDTSLFERMIKNGLAYETLEYQHRMRPNISRLLVPSIYAELKDHPSVSKYPRVRGIASDVFFLDHEISEREESDDNNSHENEYEAELIMGLCRHLMLQGYSPEEVTILTPYSGQFFLLRKIQRRLTVCLGVRICVVDNFQGEENKIILLSLVRSNEEGKVGFLRTDNRVCVALSRAKHGLYVTGNMDLLSKSSDLWKKVKSDLEKDQSFGRSLRLRCENHPDEIITVSTGEDFIKKAPEGGCLRTCNKNLPKCSHSCPKICHLDDLDHKDYKCRVPCPKKLCDLNHSCPMLCFEKCPPCQVLVPKLFTCGHTNVISCYKNPEDARCPIIVEKEMIHCQHIVKMPCHQAPQFYPCPEACDTRLDCGHQCRMKCHRTKDPDHVQYYCKQNCTKLNAGCTQNHACQRYCYEDCGKCIVKVDKKLPCGHEAKDIECHSSPESVECKAKCKRTLRPCGHACKKLCYKPCDPCPVNIKKVVPECNHEVLGDCGKPATLDMCSGPCRKLLSCSHPCTKKCNEPCTAECNELVVTTTKCPRNHPIKMPCHQVNKVIGEDTWKYCVAPCQQQLECDHLCGGTCGACFQGRLHMSCNKACNRSLVCGHLCKHPCGMVCPPCQEACNWKCKHSRCRKRCGLPCTPCQEKCRRHCEHQKCDKVCGQSCSVKPCDKPCPKKLKCGHLCVGFCGDPCPPLCRFCNAEELTEFILLGFEEDYDARFVYLEDCGHSIEVQGLEGWLGQENDTIGMKTCPRCRKSVYNSERYKNIILDIYSDVSKVKSKYFTSRVKVHKKDIELVLQDVDVASTFKQEVQEIMKVAGIDLSLARGRKNKYKQRFCSDAELHLYLFKAQVLKKSCDVLKQIPKQHRFQYPSSPSKLQISQEQASRLQSLVKEIVMVIMKKSQILAPQVEEEISCELQRLMILPSYWTFLGKVSSSPSNQSLVEIKGKLKKIMDPTVKYKSDIDKQIRQLLKESEEYIGSLSISDSERLAIVKAMGLKQGHWFKCPNGHVYCIANCGGAMQESTCLECGSPIGGTNYRLVSGNALASEMDGASSSAWAGMA